MGNDVRCGSCVRILAEPPDLKKEERTPCPHCGSKERVLTSRAILEIHVNIVAKAKARPLEMLLQSVIIPEEKTSEGLLIKAVAIPWFEIIQLLGQDPSQIFKIPPRKWEEIIAGAYDQAGFDEVILTPHSADDGRDVIAVKKGIGTVRVIDQVKAYKLGHLVTADDVRALVGALELDGASKGFLTTTSDFAPGIAENPLIQKVIPSRIELINGDKLIPRLADLAKTKIKCIDRVDNQL